jgi:bifunctional UDP-N-acetylglucosamine pyrophosphorylase/glucosamine-1-phosphate N-acetyltransferase
MSVTAVILAAGKGTRMKSDLPKVMHEVCGEPMLAHVVRACREAGCDRLICVIGHGAEMVRAAFPDDDIDWVEQTEQLGTGHAVMVASDLLKELSGPVLVLAGDGPLIQGRTLKDILAAHRKNQAASTLATCILDNPGSYGRVVRDDKGQVLSIVEFLDADEQQRKIKEVNVSIYCFDAKRLAEVLGRLTNQNAKGEYYLTDTLGLLRDAGYAVEAVAAVPPAEVLSINDRLQLAEVDELLQRRIQERLMISGVTIAQPSSTWIDSRATIGPDTTIRPHVVIDGACRIGSGCRIGPFVHLVGVEIPDNGTVERDHG